MAVVTFNVAGFKDRFPNFALASDGVCLGAFEEATVIISNNNGSYVKYDPPRCIDRRVILYNLTAHILYLEGWDNSSIKSGEGGSGAPVGRIDHAEEGEARIETAWEGNVQDGEAWFLQSQYGAKAWKMLTPYLQGFTGVATPNIWRLPVSPQIGFGGGYGGY